MGKIGWCIEVNRDKVHKLTMMPYNKSLQVFIFEKRNTLNLNVLLLCKFLHFSIH